MIPSNTRGFLLVEVLIALAVIAMGASACFYGLSQNAKVSKVLEAKHAELERLKMSQLQPEARLLNP